MCLFVSASFSFEPSESFLGMSLCDLIIWGEFPPPEHDFFDHQMILLLSRKLLEASLCFISYRHPSQMPSISKVKHTLFFFKGHHCSRSSLSVWPFSFLRLFMATSCINVPVWLLIVGAFWWAQNMTSIKETLCFIKKKSLGGLPKFRWKNPFKFPEFIGFQPFKGYFSKLRNTFPQILLGCETSKRSSMDDLLGNFSGCEMSMIYE